MMVPDIEVYIVGLQQKCVHGPTWWFRFHFALDAEVFFVLLQVLLLRFVVKNLFCQIKITDKKTDAPGFKPFTLSKLQFPYKK